MLVHYFTYLRQIPCPTHVVKTCVVPSYWIPPFYWIYSNLAFAAGLVNCMIGH